MHIFGALFRRVVFVIFLYQRLDEADGLDIIFCRTFLTFCRNAFLGYPLFCIHRFCRLVVEIPLDFVLRVLVRGQFYQIGFLVIRNKAQRRIVTDYE